VLGSHEKEIEICINENGEGKVFSVECYINKSCKIFTKSIHLRQRF
jgi:hypothetical protein